MNFFHQLSRRSATDPGGRSRAANGRRVRDRRRPRGRRMLTLDSLEQRLVLSWPTVGEVLSGTADTAIVGTVIYDLDRSGSRTSGEDGISGWTVYLDLDRSGTRNTDADGVLEPAAVTNQDGDFRLDHLRPGAYLLAQVIPDGWTPTSLAAQDVVVTLGHDTKADFFNFAGGEIVGAVWSDLNNDGVRDVDPGTGAFTDPGLAGWTVFLDLDHNRIVDPGEPTAITDADGQYRFTNVPADEYRVTEVLPAGWEPTAGFDDRQDVVVTALATSTQDFGNFSLGSGAIVGTVWNDLNNDGDRSVDPGTGAFTEPGLAGWTVFLDLGGDGNLDPGDPTAITDESGHYAFLGLAGGSYQVTEVVPEGWSPADGFGTSQLVDVNAGETATAEDFANFTVLNGSIRGTVWNDVNRNGIRDTDLSGAFTEPGLAGWVIYLDRNRNGIADEGEPTALTDGSGLYTFPDLQVGEYEVREVLPAGWETAPTFDDNQSVVVLSGVETVAGDFANFNLSTAIPGSIAGIVWDDANANGLRDTDPSTGTFTESTLEGRLVFLDLNGNGGLDPSEPQTLTAADGSYGFTNVQPGTVYVVEVVPTGWRATVPAGSVYSLALKNGQDATGLDFGNQALREAGISGTVFADLNHNGSRDPGEQGLSGLTVYLDLDNNGALDPTDPQTQTSVDQFYTPGVDEAGSYGFTHLGPGTYTVRVIVPETLGATPASELRHVVTLGTAETRTGVDTAAIYRPSEIHGIRFDDQNGNHQRDPGEPGVSGVVVYVDLDRDDALDPGEPSTLTASDGSYSFPELAKGSYVVRQLVAAGEDSTYPTTGGGVLWPDGVSNPAVGNVTPKSITTALSNGQSYSQSVSLTLPGSGALTNLVDVFLLFDDTGSFVNNSPIVRAAFPEIISQLLAALPGIDLGFGVGRFEEYGNFAYEYDTGRPFVLNQPIVAAGTAGYMTSIQAALDRTTPGYGGDQPETDIEALYQLVTGLGFDGNNNGSALDSGAAGLVSTQLNPGFSGDVPPFASFQPDPSGSVLPAAGTVGGAGFRAGALPIVLVATDTGFAYQPKGESTITGVGGVSLPLSAFAETSRPTTPYGSGAGIQQTITALNALGALVIGLGTNTEHTLDPRQALESLSIMTGAINRTANPIDNGTPTPIAPGDPLYFQIASGFSASVSSGVVSAIQNAVTSVAVDVTVRASDPRVHIVNHTGTRPGVGSGQTATFDVEFVGDGAPHRFDLQFVRAGTNVVLGSIPVVLGTTIPGQGYEFEDLEDGEIAESVDFGASASTNSAPTALAISSTSILENKPAGTVVGSFTATDPDPDQVFAFSLVPGDGSADNGSFSVSGNQLVTNGAFNFEAKSSYAIRARVTDQGGKSFEQTFTISVTNVNEVSGFDVQRGATQRSYIRYVDLAFESTDGLASLISGGRISLTRADLDGNNPVSVPIAPGVLSAQGNTVALDFGAQGIGGNRLTAAGDGYYVLSIDQDGDGVADATRRFYRLLGDVDGDRAVTSTDAALILGALGQIGPALEADVTGDGVVNALDRVIAIRQRNRRLGSSLLIDD
ncbi:MAG: SdrD B-like domain-containing protein [Isosphaeraceae bacterium]